MKASDIQLTREYGKGWRLSVLLDADSVQEAMRTADSLRGKVLDIVMKVFRPRRSTTANAYAWELMGKIGKVFSPPITNEYVYEMMLKMYAPVTLIELRSDINPAGFFNHYEVLSDDGMFKTLKVYKGSSQYDSKEMSVFIDGVVDEAKALGIETLTQAELESMYASKH